METRCSISSKLREFVSDNLTFPVSVKKLAEDAIAIRAKLPIEDISNLVGRIDKYYAGMGFEVPKEDHSVLPKSKLRIYRHEAGGSSIVMVSKLRKCSYHIFVVDSETGSQRNLRNKLRLQHTLLKQMYEDN